MQHNPNTRNAVSSIPINGNLWLVPNDLSPRDVTVMRIIISYWTPYLGDPTPNRIAELTHYSRRTVTRALASLESRGLPIPDPDFAL
jgi:hypothetical protein